MPTQFLDDHVVSRAGQSKSAEDLDGPSVALEHPQRPADRTAQMDDRLRSLR
jgi:hypothetical protein